MSRTQAVVSSLLAGFVLTVLSAVAGAVGLGEVTLRSALTEPLDAEIRITNPDDLTQEELNVRLASNEDFRRAGVERPFFLSQLEFNVRPDGDGFVIEVTSSDPVEEPFLDFLVELRWPSGRLIREYTLLLDPPIFAEGDSVMEQSFPATDPFAGAPAAEPAPELPEVEAPSQPQPTQPERRVEDLPDSQYRVANNDTLWEIALRARQDPSQSPQQVMLAIQDMNPDAFIGGNINRVKAGSLLNLPDAEQVAVRSAAEANQEVSRQNAALTGTPPATEAQITATDDTATGLADGDPERDPDGFLEVVTEPGEPDEAAAADGTDESELARLQNELAIQQELNDELRRQYDEQQSRLGDLEEQVELLSRLMDLQSESAAQLQAAAEELERLEAEAEREEALEEEGLTEDDQPVVPAPEPITPPSDLAEAPADPDAPTTPATEPDMPAEAEPPAAEEPTPTVPDLDAPVAVSPWTIVDDLIEWFRNPLNAVLVLSGLVLILGLLNLARKRRAAKAEEEELDVDEDLMEEDPDSDVGLDEEADMDDDLPADDPTVADQAASVGAGSAAAEAIENAELYMAFQRYDEAENALKTALEQAPGEPSLQQKLLELYAETGNRSAFEKLAGSFSGSAEALDNLRSQMQGQSSDSFGSEDLDEEFGAGEFDDLDLDLDLELDEEEGQPAAPRQEAVSDFPDLDDDFEVPELEDTLEDDGDGMDFDFTPEPAESKPEPEPAAADPRDAGMDLDFDLSDSELPEKTPEPAPAEPSNDFGEDDLDLDFDFGDLDADEAGDTDPAWDLDKDSKPVDSPDEDVLSDIPELEDPFASDEDPTEDWGDLTDEAPAPEEELPEPQAFEQDSDTDPAPVVDEPMPEPEEPAMTASADDEGEWDEDFDFLAGTDEIATKLDLARAYIDMEDGEGARDILNEVLEEGNDEQKSDARKLLETI